MRWLGWLALGASAVALSACGSKAKSASVGTTAQQAPSAPAQSTATTTPSTTTTAPAAGSTGGGTEAQTTRTATEPAFTSQPSSAEGLNAAIATVRAHGYQPVSTSDYHPSQTLRVLIGRGTGSSSPHRAFFFVTGRYIGSDASAPSGMLQVVAQSDTEVTLAYSLYRPGDSSCCPGGGQARVRFQLNNGRLVALDPIPPVSSGAASSRR
jgi:LppP/LprE lipoprotein